jgi:hypothetical protein
MKLYWILFFIGIVFGIGETWYFGWNAHPQSAAEQICDLIAIAFIVASCLAKPATTHYHISGNDINIGTISANQSEKPNE